MKNKFTVFSFICFGSCILIWVPNVIFQVPSPFWILTFIIAPFGLAFAFLAKNYWLAFGNVVMFFSFFILMAVGYYINSQL
ncbi:hypothetical protein [Salinicoccus sp. HZC-1]|uniref:hypothetical protein n=1 Tax=Salinicoccus sp. HZC-1 TaxID=3385497 RepID=UPI00398B3AB5